MYKVVCALVLLVVAVHYNEVQAFTSMTNLALNQPAVQVHQWGQGFPAKAVDGNANPAFSAGSCSTTNHGSQPWWSVDLGQTSTIHGFRITNRGDAHDPTRLNNFRVYLTDTAPSTGSPPRYDAPGSSVCYHYPGVAGQGEVIEEACAPGTVGRYAVVQIMNTNAGSILTLCEVELYGVAGAGGGASVPFNQLPNIALNQPAVQVHQWGAGTAGKAVDGNDHDNYNAGFCSTTNHGPQPWWSVDLGQTSDIRGFKITNRRDGNIGWRLNNFRVYATDSPPSVSSPPSYNAPGSRVCYYYPGVAASGEVIEQPCNSGTQGRYLVVQLMGTNAAEILTLCEVEVYGGALGSLGSLGGGGATDDVPYNQLPNVALNKPATQVHQWGAGTPGKAVDGNDNDNYNAGYCSTTNHGPQPWWSVDLLDTYDVRGFRITNRRDGNIGWRLNNFRVYATDTPPSVSSPPRYDAAGSTVCYHYPGVAASGEVIDQPCASGTQGRYVVVQLMGTNAAEILTLCEVEIFGAEASSADSECTAALELCEANLQTCEADAGSSAALEVCQAKLREASNAAAELKLCQADLEEALAALPQPELPEADPTAVLSDTAYQFTLSSNGIKYIVETTPMKISLESDDFCQQYGMKLAQVENEETRDALSLQLKSIQEKNGITLTEVATGERSAVNLDRDVPIDALNAAGWNCVTFVPDGSSFKLVGKKCNGNRAVLCAVVPLYC